MKIAVCVSHVPDTATRIKIGADRKAIDPTGVTYIINPYDEFAVEEALKTKEKIGGDSIVYVISVGGDANKESIRKALAMGVDEGILLKDDSSRDSFGVAHALADEIKSLGCEIAFFGKQDPTFAADIEYYGQLTKGTRLKIEMVSGDHMSSLQPAINRFITLIKAGELN